LPPASAEFQDGGGSVRDHAGADGSEPLNQLEKPMPKFVIERDIPGAGKLSPAELKSISQKSCGVLSSLGPSVQWVQSYVTADKIYCVYQAQDESLVRRHAELGGFPANRISRVTSIIDPATAE
jgi:Nickel responsive protein SCO4226-like